MNKDFDEIFQIMDESFPDSEMRTYEGQLALLSEKEYRVLSTKDASGKIVAFITLWEFPDFSYIEHLATTESVRGKGIGSALLQQYIDSIENPIILEVEPPTTPLAIRRIRFYERLNFHLNDYPFEQPALRADTLPCELKIMSYPCTLSEQQFSHYTDVLFERVYKRPKK